MATHRPAGYFTVGLEGKNMRGIPLMDKLTDLERELLELTRVHIQNEKELIEKEI